MLRARLGLRFAATWTTLRGLRPCRVATSDVGHVVAARSGPDELVQPTTTTTEVPPYSGRVLVFASLRPGRPCAAFGLAGWRPLTLGTSSRRDLAQTSWSSRPRRRPRFRHTPGASRSSLRCDLDDPARPSALPVGLTACRRTVGLRAFGPARPSGLRLLSHLLSLWPRASRRWVGR